MMINLNWLSIKIKHIVFLLIALLVIPILAVGLVGCGPTYSDTTKVALIPLDSRPCNTQYPQLIGQMFNAKVELPAQGLDNFIKPADSAQLWAWLEAQAQQSDSIVICTNELLQGGLIGSRDPAAYQEMPEKIKKLKAFCETYQDKNIYILTVLPRLLPSQFTNLVAYEKQLVALAQAIDLENGQAERIMASLPEKVVTGYLSIYQQTQVLAEAIMSWTELGWVDHYLIGQDDAATFGLSNKVLRELPLADYAKVSFVHGADELTSMLVARLLDQLTEEQKQMQLIYTDPSCVDKQYPFESAPLNEVMQTKLNYLGWQVAENAPVLEIAHTKATGLAVLEEIPQGESYTGLMDFAYINRSDTRLWEMDVLNKVTGYAGWNTVSNTIGLELAYLTAHQNLSTFYSRYAPESLDQALLAQMAYQFIRQAEEMVYQGMIRSALNDTLRRQKLNPYDLKDHKAVAENIIHDKFQNYKPKLIERFEGLKRLGERQYAIDKIDATIGLPWSRTFESRIMVTGQVVWERK